MVLPRFSGLPLWRDPIRFLIKAIPLRKKIIMRHYYHLIGEFVIHENGNNIVIEIDPDGHERRFDATLDPGYNRDINHYLANRKHWEISESLFRLELEQEKASVEQRRKEMEKMRLICFPPVVF